MNYFVIRTIYTSPAQSVGYILVLLTEEMASPKNRHNYYVLFFVFCFFFVLLYTLRLFMATQQLIEL